MAVESLINIYGGIVSDFEKDCYAASPALERTLSLLNNMDVRASVDRKMQLCVLTISVASAINPEIITQIPRWKGMDIEINCSSPVAPSTICFKQKEGYDKRIFILIMQDVADEVNSCKPDVVIQKIRDVLVKWKSFFQFDKDPVLSDNVQQGLYGELCVLEKLIELHGENAIYWWAGCNAEEHDFYCLNNIIEVKSSSSLGAEKVHISNEFQLESLNETSILYLYYIKLKKSAADGETLSTIVSRISGKLGVNLQSLFQEKLLQVGYIHQLPELYKIHFRVRDESCYIVKDDFPRIKSKDLPNGISSVNYELSLSSCNKYMITIEEFYKEVFP